MLEPCEGSCLAIEDYRDAAKARHAEHLRPIGVTMGEWNGWRIMVLFPTMRILMRLSFSWKQVQSIRRHWSWKQHLHSSFSSETCACSQAKHRRSRRRVVQRTCLAEFTEDTVTPDLHHGTPRWYTSHPAHSTNFRIYEAAKLPRSALESLNQVLHWAWKLHTAAKGEECPHNLSNKCEWEHSPITFTRKPLTFRLFFSASNMTVTIVLVVYTSFRIQMMISREAASPLRVVR